MAKRGRPAHKPTKETRERVKRGAAFRESVSNLARVLGITEKTLRKHYKEELEIGHLELKDVVASAAVREVQNGNTAVIIFMLKDLWGMSEGRQAEADTPLPRVQVEVITKSDRDAPDTENG